MGVDVIIPCIEEEVVVEDIEASKSRSSKGRGGSFRRAALPPGATVAPGAAVPPGATVPPGASLPLGAVTRGIAKSRRNGKNYNNIMQSGGPIDTRNNLYTKTCFLYF